jgi:hypothetical protein
MRLNALFRLAFAPAPHHWLTSPHTVTRRLILQKARHRGQDKPDDALTDCGPTVSGTISLPSRGTFHHSLTVLFAIGRLDILSLTKWSSQIHADLLGFGATRDADSRLMTFVYRALTFCGAPFLNASTSHQLGNSMPVLVHRLSVPRPRRGNATRLDTTSV